MIRAGGRPGRPALGFFLAALALSACSPSGGSGAAQASPRDACITSLDPATGIEACRAAITGEATDAAVYRRLGLLRLKSRSLAAARQAYQIALSEAPGDPESQFGLGLTLETIGEAGGNLQKLAAAKRDPAVIDTFRKYGFAEPDLLTFDTAPKILGGPSLATTKAMTPKLALASSLGLDVKCLVGATGRLHDCALITPVAPAQAPFGEAAKAIVALSRVTPARNDGKVVPDAPVLLTMVYGPTT